jgi:hypothetical protein
MTELPRLPTVKEMEQVFEQELRINEETLRNLTDEELREMERLLGLLTSED